MTRVLLDASVSVDGYMAGPEISIAHPMGTGGERLHEWLFAEPPDERDSAIARDMHATTGAVILGRRTFDVGIEVWNDTPFAAPCFVLTHSPLEDRVEKSGTFHFAENVTAAYKRAIAAAGDLDVRLMGAGASQAFLDAGLVDEIRIQLVPVLLGSGQRMFNILGAAAELERLSTIDSQHVTHLRYRVVK